MAPLVGDYTTASMGVGDEFGIWPFEAIAIVTDSGIHQVKTSS